MAGGNLNTVATLGHPVTPACFLPLCTLHHLLAFAENLLHAGLHVCDTCGPTTLVLTFCLEFIYSSIHSFICSFICSLIRSTNPPKPGCSVAGLRPAAGDSVVKEATLLSAGLMRQWQLSGQGMLRPPQHWGESTALEKASLRGDFGAEIRGGKGGRADVWGRCSRQRAPKRDSVRGSEEAVWLEGSE